MSLSPRSGVPPAANWAVKALADDKALRDEPLWQNSAGVVTIDSFTDGIRRIAQEKNEWAGLPVPLQGERLVMDPSYAWADKIDQLNEILKPSEPKEPSNYDDAELVKVFRSARDQRNCIIWKKDCRYHAVREPLRSNADVNLTTIGCAQAFPIESEYRALELLQSMVRPYQFRCYFLTGSFLEKSNRSGIYYMFRKLRPTIAMSGKTGKMKVLCTLCLHPVGYYENSWLGAQCPTDDVIAHLTLSRGDEHMFWRRANQHHPLRPESGI